MLHHYREMPKIMWTSCQRRRWQHKRTEERYITIRIKLKIMLLLCASSINRMWIKIINCFSLWLLLLLLLSSVGVAVAVERLCEQHDRLWPYEIELKSNVEPNGRLNSTVSFPLTRFSIGEWIVRKRTAHFLHSRKQIWMHVNVVVK